MSGASTSSSLYTVPRFLSRKLVCKYTCTNAPRQANSSTSRHFATSNVHHYPDNSKDPYPRWRQTPSAMQAPFRLRPAKPRVTRVNEDPELLDQAMIRVLGRGGDELLTDEVKWLSVTHKSFDHGRRGYNARLAYFGKRIVDLQTSIALVNTSTATLAPPVEDQYGRMPFQHPALERLPLLNNETLHTSKELSRVASVAVKYRLIDVIRWEPKSYSLKGSGSEKVSAQALYAIVGAVALQNGGQVAIRIVQERILSPLGLT